MRAFFGALVCVASVACDPPTFEPASLVQSVRILATRSDTPYAAPGATVTLSVLALDERPVKREKMHVYWLPSPCINPAGDAYYACFPAFSGTFPGGTDLASRLIESDTLSFRVPSQIIESHASENQDPYGLSVVFTLACAGHVRYLPPAPGGSPDAVPFACFDDSGARLGAEDFVFAYSLVYVFSDRENENPVLAQVTYGGQPIDPDLGLSLPHCVESKLSDCPATQLDVQVPAVSQELDPSNLDESGNPLREELYVQYYANGGKITNDVTVLFDPRRGRLDHTGNDFRVPLVAGEYQLWVIVHDNRGGATWQTRALHVN